MAGWAASQQPSALPSPQSPCHSFQMAAGETASGCCVSMAGRCEIMSVAALCKQQRAPQVRGVMTDFWGSHIPHSAFGIREVSAGSA